MSLETTEQRNISRKQKKVLTNSDFKSSYPHFNQILKYDDMKFPISLTDVSKFENKYSW